MRAGPGGPQDIVIDQETARLIGEFGYELTINPPITFNNGDTLLIRHGGSGPRLLHQVGDEARNICWSIGSDSEICEPDYDYPLLAFETGIQLCIESRFCHRLMLVPLLLQILQGVLRDWCQHLN
jgi:hypothetical protein